jgi:hypothetical protein
MVVNLLQLLQLQHTLIAEPKMLFAGAMLQEHEQQLSS